MHCNYGSALQALESLDYLQVALVLSVSLLEGVPLNDLDQYNTLKTWMQ